MTIISHKKQNWYREYTSSDRISRVVEKLDELGKEIKETLSTKQEEDTVHLKYVE